MLVINPDECIDCGVCEPECPVEAIIPDVNPKADEFLELNRKFSNLWPVLTRKRPHSADAHAFKDVPNKMELFSEAPGEGD